MDLRELQENIVSEKLKYRGFEINLKIKPDALVESKSVSNGEYLFSKLHDWDITDGGNKVEVNLQTIEGLNQELFAAILNKVIEVVNAPLGK